jgi:hypothetical protein
MGGARLATTLGTRLPGWIARGVGYGVEGAGVGALQGAGNTYTGKLQDYVDNAKMGAVFGGAGGALVGGAFGPRPNVSSAAHPTVPQQRRFTDAAYTELRANPTEYNPFSFRLAADNLERRLGDRFEREYAPAAMNAPERMRQTNPVTLREIEATRRRMNEIPASASTDRTAGRMVKDTLDDFVANPPLFAVRPGQEAAAAEAARISQVARDSRSALGRSETLQNLTSDAQRQAARSHSGLNLENNLRTALDTQLLKATSESAKRRLATFNPEERTMLENFVTGGAGRGANTLRYVGNFLGGGGGVGALATTAAGAGYHGLTTGDWSGAGLGGGALAGAGLGLRMAANRAANRRMQTMRDTISERSPLYQYWRTQAPMVPSGGMSPGATASLRDAMTVGLLKQTQPLRITVDKPSPPAE